MILVSLTTIPPRFQYLPVTINSILNQTTMPDKIIIHIPQKYNNYSNDYLLPQFSDERIIVNTEVTDYGPATKLLGIYNHKIYNEMHQDDEDDDVIIIIDDDRIYNTNFIKNMLTYHKLHMDKVLTVSGWDVETLSDKKYIINDKKQPRGVEFTTEGYIDFVGGCCGYLIPKQKCPFNSKDIFELYPNDDKYYVDDIWISGFLTLNNTEIYLIPNAIYGDELRNQNNNISPLADHTRAIKNLKCIEYFRENYQIWR